MVSAHSDHATTPGHQRDRGSWKVGVTAVVLAARSAPWALPPPMLVGCQCGRLASGQRYEGRTGPRHQAFVKQALKCQVSSATTTSRQLDQRYDDRDAKLAGVPLRRVCAVEGAGRLFSTPSRPALRAAGRTTTATGTGPHPPGASALVRVQRTNVVDTLRPGRAGVAQGRGGV